MIICHQWVLITRNAFSVEGKFYRWKFEFLKKEANSMVSLWINIKTHDLPLSPLLPSVSAIVYNILHCFPLLHPQHRSLSEDDLKSDFTTWGTNPFNSFVLCSNVTTMITTVTMTPHLGSYHLPAIVLRALRALFIPNNLHYGLCSLVFICHC